jgi:hypothetical protein
MQQYDYNNLSTPPHLHVYVAPHEFEHVHFALYPQSDDECDRRRRLVERLTPRSLQLASELPYRRTRRRK